jgi:hypothetical protein
MWLTCTRHGKSNHHAQQVQCHDFDMLLAQSKHQSRPGHLQHNMKGDRDAVRARLKTKCSVFSDESDCDSDIEIISVCKRAREDSIEISDHTPTCVHIDSSILSLSPSTTCFSPPPTSSPKQGSSVLLTPTASSLSRAFSSPPPVARDSTPTITQVRVPIYEPNRRDVWPTGMYTVDMAEGFRQMKDKRLRRVYLQPALFRHVFGCPLSKALIRITFVHGKIPVPKS